MLAGLAPTQQPESGTTGGGVPLLELRGIEKSYGGSVALRGASLVVERSGVIHTLIGQNGCGKSSMLGVLSGQIQPDAGEILIDGRPLRFHDAADAVRHGIAMVSQETAVAEHLTVAENILLGRLARTHGMVDWRESRRRATEVMSRIGIHYDPAQIVGTLRPDQKQMVEIARAISLNSRILILDEPTSSLTEGQVKELFTALRTLADSEVSIVFVSHRLPEVFEISSAVTVMRNGLTIASGPTSHFTPDSLVATMVGTEMAKVNSDSGRRRFANPNHTAAVRLDRVDSAEVVRGVDLELHHGRIIGVAGLEGSGRSELLEVIFGSRDVTGGALNILGTQSGKRSPRTAIAAGIGYVPPDRKLQGLVLSMSITENAAMVSTHSAARWNIIKGRTESGLVARAVATFALRFASAAMPVRSLSGGNQQKVLFAKWLASQPRVLLLDEPTRGVDVAAKAELHAALRDAADGGLALLVSSSEVPELIDLCDEIVVMYRGAIVRRFESHDMTEVAIATVAAGGQL
ncbi:sugar ABC transporter ATP-binding protein [Rhodococcus fascians]|nr:sugar ABC transporter ATP-binding protein [Rhodococcus fascians]MBY4398986.1 sugar ABC transporter ATP-binding protein [Rhodococcus fascians]MBY4408524.1 sugar ABC transporter ATP-binding protein [Rhodococcus fascians]MBY4423563.1 sugar ABC transporter ATP-binding protein [Rhodococcus fascians]MBY4462913.1 sugar ABC transporter ATP-binding protein [Rhodococcus fascians]